MTSRSLKTSLRPPIPKVRMQGTPVLSGFILFLITTLCATRPLRGETLENPLFIRTGSDPTQLLQGDFNNDGKADLAYRDGTTRSLLHILLGVGDGTFQHGQDIPLPWDLGGLVTAADVNNDAKLDLIVGGQGEETHFAVMLGNGEGSFQSPVVSRIGVGIYAWAALASFGVADINGDGAVDLVVSDGQNNAIYTLLGDNSGLFTLKGTFTQYTGPGTILIDDFNGDHRADFLVVNRWSWDVAVHLGNGDGTFQAGVRYTGPDNIGGVVLADMDGDGHSDMVGVGRTGIVILHGNADGTFANTSSGGSSYGGLVLAVFDFDGDGVLDIATATTSGIVMLRGNGNLTFSPVGTFLAGPPEYSAALADFNGDDRRDFAVIAPGGIALLLGQSNGALKTFDTYDLGESVSHVSVADFNNDGFPDIAVDVSEKKGRLLLGTGGGEFNLAPDTIQGPSGDSIGDHILTGDFNGDGKADIFFFGGITSGGTAFYGNGDSTFSDPVRVEGFGMVGFGAAAVADLNGDGKSDIVLMTYESFAVLLGQANKTFTLLTDYQWGGVFVPPAFGDFDEDGRLDMVLAGITTLQIMLGNGDGTFRLGRSLSTQFWYGGLNAPRAIVTRDFDGDGNLDIVVPISYPDFAEIFYGKGDGTFEDPVRFQLTRGYAHVAAADLNRDGRPDLVFANDKGIAVIHNNGNRVFGPEVHYLAGTIWSLTARDLNGDSMPDLVVGNGNATTVSALLSHPGGNAVSGALTVSPEPSSLGEPYTISLSIGPAQPDAGSPTGIVQFSVDGTPLGAVPVGGATVVYTDTSSPEVGVHTILAEYRGDASFLPGSSSATHTVVPVVYPTETSLTAAPNPILASRTLALTATVTSAGPAIPTGRVGFYDGATTLGAAYLDSQGVAIFDTALLSPGTHSVKASCLGDINSARSVSAPVIVTVTAYATFTTLQAMPDSIQSGAAVSLIATVSSSSGTPTGAVTFSDGATPLAAQPLDASGVGVYTGTFSSSGTHTITASYRANASYASSTSSPLNLTVSDAAAASNATHMSLVATRNAQMAGSLIFTATVRARSGAPPGRVTFFDGGTRLGEAVIDPRGNASYVSVPLAPGRHYITAFYPGRAGFGPSVATAALDDPAASPADFSLAASPATTTVVRGQSTVVQVLVSPVNGFSQNVVLSCSTGTQELTCSFHPGIVRGGSGTSELTISTVPLHLGHSCPNFTGVGWPYSFLVGVVLCFILFLASGFRRRQIAVFAASLLCLGLTLGCGHEHPAAWMPRPSAYYGITVTASSLQGGVSISHSFRVQVTVEGP